MGTFTKIIRKIEKVERELKDIKSKLDELRRVVKWETPKQDLQNKLNKIKQILN